MYDRVEGDGSSWKRIAKTGEYYQEEKVEDCKNSSTVSIYIKNDSKINAEEARFHGQKVLVSPIYSQSKRIFRGRKQCIKYLTRGHKRMMNLEKWVKFGQVKKKKIKLGTELFLTKHNVYFVPTSHLLAWGSWNPPFLSISLSCRFCPWNFSSGFQMAVYRLED